MEPEERREYLVEGPEAYFKILEGSDSDDSDFSYSEPKSGSREGNKCGFVCCSMCMSEHRCGDDPTEYC